MDAIQAKFPGCLLELEIQPGMLPTSVTAREAVDHVLANIRTNTAANQDFYSLLEEIMQLKYEPSANGPVLYFSEVERIQLLMKQLDKGSIDTDKVISLAQRAFMNSGHNKPLVARINTDWDTAARINVDWAAAPIKKYVAFKGHYIRELRLLYQHGDTGTNEQAHLTETLQRQVDDLTHRLENVSATADSVVSKQERFSSEFANSSCPLF